MNPNDLTPPTLIQVQAVMNLADWARFSAVGNYSDLLNAYIANAMATMSNITGMPDNVETLACTYLVAHYVYQATRDLNRAQSKQIGQLKTTYFENQADINPLNDQYYNEFARLVDSFSDNNASKPTSIDWKERRWQTNGGHIGDITI